MLSRELSHTAGCLRDIYFCRLPEGHLFLNPALLQAEHNHSPLVMVGDGATDLEARQSGGADLFIG